VVEGAASEGVVGSGGRVVPGGSESSMCQGVTKGWRNTCFLLREVAGRVNGHEQGFCAGLGEWGYGLCAWGRADGLKQALLWHACIFSFFFCTSCGHVTSGPVQGWCW
jgi:hypothetical protein